MEKHDVDWALVDRIRELVPEVDMGSRRLHNVLRARAEALDPSPPFGKLADRALLAGADESPSDVAKILLACARVEGTWSDSLEADARIWLDAKPGHDRAFLEAILRKLQSLVDGTEALALSLPDGTVPVTNVGYRNASTVLRAAFLSMTTFDERALALLAGPAREVLAEISGVADSDAMLVADDGHHLPRNRAQEVLCLAERVEELLTSSGTPTRRAVTRPYFITEEITAGTPPRAVPRPNGAVICSTFLAYLGRSPELLALAPRDRYPDGIGVLAPELFDRLAELVEAACSGMPSDGASDTARQIVRSLLRELGWPENSVHGVFDAQRKQEARRLASGGRSGR
jgi:hypothetical protein